MSLVVRVLARLGGLALGLFLYVELVADSWGKRGDANIGAGLLGFALLAVGTFGWALVDARRRGMGAALWCWATVSAVFAIGWLVVLSLSEDDASMSTRELLLADLPMVPFICGLLLVPAATGAAIGTSIGKAGAPRRERPDSGA
jgi:hypothetical protein